MGYGMQKFGFPRACLPNKLRPKKVSTVGVLRGEKIADDQDQSRKVSLKLLIDKTKNKVLFAEAGKDFVDFLFNLMSMPIGTVTRLLTKNSMVGSLGNLYGSIENLNDFYLQTKETKESLLKPKLPSSASEVPLMLLPNHDAVKVPKHLYQCRYSNTSSNRSCANYATDNPKTPCPYCGAFMNRVVTYVTTPTRGGSLETTSLSSEGGGFVKGLVSFMVTDDLVVTPMATISSITSLINEFGVKGIDKVEERVVHLGMDQGLMLLKESLQSDIVLSKVFLKQPLSGIKASTGSSKKIKKRKSYF